MTIPRRDLEQMLKHCAPGHRLITKTHYQWVEWNGKQYRTLPRPDAHKDIEVGKVRQLIRVLQIPRDCVTSVLRQAVLT